MDHPQLQLRFLPSRPVSPPLTFGSWSEGQHSPNAAPRAPEHRNSEEWTARHDRHLPLCLHLALLWRSAQPAQPALCPHPNKLPPTQHMRQTPDIDIERVSTPPCTTPCITSPSSHLPTCCSWYPEGSLRLQHPQRHPPHPWVPARAEPPPAPPPGRSLSLPPAPHVSALSQEAPSLPPYLTLNFCLPGSPHPNTIPRAAALRSGFSADQKPGWEGL